MISFSIEAFFKESKTGITGGRNREQANREIFETYCAYLQQQQKGATNHG